MYKIPENEISDLKKMLSDMNTNVSNLTSKVALLTSDMHKMKGTPLVKKNNSDYDPADLNKDGKVSKIELMVVQTLKSVAEKTQATNIKTLAIILTFLLLSAILQAIGIPLFS